ncbi:MAG: acyl-CoA dehydrogenase [Rhodocyclales bacterium]|nr:acyl-CoA dehydrogenase [Rhodocyclales bacterium]
MDYRAPVDDILFALRHGADAQRLPGWDPDATRELLHEAARFIEGEIAPLDPEGDRSPARLTGGRVQVAPAFRSAYARYRQSGWGRLAAPVAYGGEGLPQALAASLSEMLAGACASFQMMLSLVHGAIRAIEICGSPAQCERYLPLLVSGDWLATMCLTEPQAGSNLGAIRTTATPDGAGQWTLRGEKIFISAGDHDLTDNILHLVLARTPGAPGGVRGLSLFLCGAVRPDGQRNAVHCMRVEEKMGLHASPTCHMAFDGARAELLGTEGEGLAHMFVMMNAQRLDVAVQATGLAQVATQRARDYAAQRCQGTLENSGQPAPILHHPDVGRMLLTQMALTEGCRALNLRTCVELELGNDAPLIEFLTPVCKAFSTDSAVDTAQLAIQVHGGYGYLREFRVEQVLRDVRITQIYEGTNGILGKTLANRVLRAHNGESARAFRRDVSEAIARASGATASALDEALGHWNSAAIALQQRRAMLHLATPFMRLTGLLAVGAAWARLEASADLSPNPQRTLAGAAFYRDWLLSECAGIAARIRAPSFFPARLDEICA